MSTPLQKTALADGVTLNTVVDEKFKHNRISVNFFIPLDAARAADNAVVPHILRTRCAALPDFSALNARLQELYGAVLDADVLKFGGYQVLEVTIRGLDNRYAMDGEDVTAQCAQLLCDIVLNPYLENGLFEAKDVALQRQYVLDAIEAEINDKRSYALSQCIQVMCEGEPVAVRRYGTTETAGAITPASATAAYRDVVRTSPVEIVFVGAGDPAPVEKIFRDAFAGLERAPIGYKPLNLRTDVGTVKNQEESMELSQSKLVLGFRCGKLDSERKLRSARLFSALYGGTPFSRLFMNVREKLSLCYYCSSRFDVTTGLMMVDSGIETQNRQLAQDEIMKQLQGMADGAFSDEELADTKLMVSNSLRTVTDSLGGIEGWYLAQIPRGKNTTPAEDVQEMDTITREEIVAIAQQVQLDTAYFLTGKEEQQ